MIMVVMTPGSEVQQIRARTFRDVCAGQSINYHQPKQEGSERLGEERRQQVYLKCSSRHRIKSSEEDEDETLCPLSARLNQTEAD